jgi:hypothetical protein
VNPEITTPHPATVYTNVILLFLYSFVQNMKIKVKTKPKRIKVLTKPKRIKVKKKGTHLPATFSKNVKLGKKR